MDPNGPDRQVRGESLREGAGSERDRGGEAGRLHDAAEVPDPGQEEAEGDAGPDRDRVHDENDLHLDSVYLSKNENVYGRVDKIETDQSKSTKENLQAWAQGRLNKHCEPTVSITISGLEL